jgi:CheY-like chemotaxis protein
LLKARLIFPTGAHYSMPKPIRILIADDDPEDQEILQEYLLKENPALTFLGVLTGGEVMRRLDRCIKTELPKLIILDYKMPALSAVDVLQRIKQNARYAGIPIVVWSTSNRADHRALCLANGAMEYFSKPASHRELILLAQRMLQAIPSETEERQ